MRLDLALVERALAKSRTRSASLIRSGAVSLNGVVVTKPAAEVSEGDRIEITGEDHPYVGRGGLKLEAALAEFRVDPAGLVCADIGASTGGFTDCLLKRGAARVYAVDAGHDQLDPVLREDPRVINREGVNARTLNQTVIPEPCALAVLDLSFVSQTLVLPALKNVLAPDADYIGLIKPQFECGREALGKGGVIRDRRQHAAAIRKVLRSLEECGFGARSLMRSPVRGGDGNTEFLVHARLGEPCSVHETTIREVTHE